MKRLSPIFRINTPRIHWIFHLPIMKEDINSAIEEAKKRLEESLSEIEERQKKSLLDQLPFVAVDEVY